MVILAGAVQASGRPELGGRDLEAALLAAYVSFYGG